MQLNFTSPSQTTTNVRNLRNILKKNHFNKPDVNEPDFFMIKLKTALTFSNVESFLSKNMENNRGWQ